MYGVSWRVWPLVRGEWHSCSTAMMKPQEWRPWCSRINQVRLDKQVEGWRWVSERVLNNDKNRRPKLPKNQQSETRWRGGRVKDRGRPKESWTMTGTRCSILVFYNPDTLCIYNNLSSPNCSFHPILDLCLLHFNYHHIAHSLVLLS